MASEKYIKREGFAQKAATSHITDLIDSKKKVDKNEQASEQVFYPLNVHLFPPMSPLMFNNTLLTSIRAMVSLLFLHNMVLSPLLSFLWLLPTITTPFLLFIICSPQETSWFSSQQYFIFNFEQLSKIREFGLQGVAPFAFSRYFFQNLSLF